MVVGGVLTGQGGKGSVVSPVQPALLPTDLMRFSNAMMSASEGRCGTSPAVLSITASPGAVPPPPPAAAAAAPAAAAAASCCRWASSREACIARAMLLSQSSGSCGAGGAEAA